MATEILMPALSPTMEEGKLAKWLVKEGDSVKPGDVLAEIETDKATMEVEAIDEGRLAKILVEEGSEGVKVNTPIAVLAADGEDVAAAGAPAKAPAEDSDDTPAEPPGQDKSRRAPGPEESAAAPAAKADEEAAAPAVMKAPAPDPEVPEGTEMVNMTVREALRDAMAEEMRRDERVF
jgi:pyruvate dehydrogenase E1 component beta subunit